MTIGSRQLTFFKSSFHLLHSPCDLGIATGTVQLAHLHLSSILLLVLAQVWVALYGSHLSLDPFQFLQNDGSHINDNVHNNNNNDEDDNNDDDDNNGNDDDSNNQIAVQLMMS